MANATTTIGRSAPSTETESRLSARHIRAACDASLRRMQTDHIDLYQMQHIDRRESLCDDLGEQPAAVALAWLLVQDGVTCPIVGPRTMDQIDGAPLRALDLSLDTDTLTLIDAIFPGPGGTAPEAYAW